MGLSEQHMSSSNADITMQCSGGVVVLQKMGVVTLTVITVGLVGVVTWSVITMGKDDSSVLGRLSSCGWGGRGGQGRGDQPNVLETAASTSLEGRRNQVL